MRAKDCCAVYAEIRVNDKPLFVTSEPQPIPDLSHPEPIQLALVPLHGNKQANPPQSH
jgi:hypothetical protein